MPLSKYFKSKPPAPKPAMPTDAKIEKGSKYDKGIADNYAQRRSLEKAGANQLWTKPFKDAENAWESLSNADIADQRRQDPPKRMSIGQRIAKPNEDDDK